MPDLLHLPKPNFRSTPRTDFPPYPKSGEGVDQLLQLVRVHSVTAIDYACSAEWEVNRGKRDDLFFFITSGRCYFEIGEYQGMLGAGDCVHLHRGVAPRAYTDSLNPPHMMILHYTATILESLMLSELLPLPDVMHLGMASPVRAMLEEACREYALRPAGWEADLNALTLRLLFHLIREQATEGNRVLPPKKMVELQRLQPALTAIREHLDTPLPMHDLAQLCGLSIAQFRRVFRSALGQSPIEYTHRIRMEAACRLLQHTDEPVEAIATRVGYIDPSFFSRNFKKIIGVPPGRYRTTVSS